MGLGAQAGLDTESSWMTAVSKTLARQGILGNVVSETFKAITRIAGWGLMTLVLYGNVFEKKRKKRMASLGSSREDADQMEARRRMLERFLEENENFADESKHKEDNTWMEF